MPNTLSFTPCCGRSHVTDDMLVDASQLPMEWRPHGAPVLCGICLDAVYHAGTPREDVARALGRPAQAIAKARKRDDLEADLGVTLTTGKPKRDVLREKRKG